MSVSRKLAASLLAAALPALAGAANEAVTPTGTVHGVAETALRLAVVQVCRPAGQNCRLGFADVDKNDDVAAVVAQRLEPGGEAPAVQSLAICAASWVAAVHSSHGSSVVCGYPSEKAALSAALEACDAQSAGACRQSGTLRVSWGRWDGRQPAGGGAGSWYQEWPQGQACEGELPLRSSASCGESALQTLRSLQVR